jgi:hypothetical protein
MIMIIIQGSKSTFKKSGAKFEKKFEKRKPYIFFHFEYHKYNILLL